MLKALVHEAYESGVIDRSYTENFVFTLLHTLFSNYNEIFKDECEMNKSLKNLEKYVRFIKNGLKSQS